MAGLLLRCTLVDQSQEEVIKIWGGKKEIECFFIQMTFKYPGNGILVATHNMSAVRFSRLTLTFTTQSAADERELLVSEDISNLETCECSLGFCRELKKKCFRATEKPWWAELLISYGSALTSTSNLKHLEKLHSVLIEKWLPLCCEWTYYLQKCAFTTFLFAVV